MRDYLEELQKLDEEFDASAEGCGFQLRLDFAEILWVALHERGWSQAQLARKAGWAESFVSNLMNANQNCELDTIGKAFHALGVRASLRIVDEHEAEHEDTAPAFGIVGFEEDEHGSEEESTYKYCETQETDAPSREAFQQSEVGHFRIHCADHGGRQVTMG